MLHNPQFDQPVQVFAECCRHNNLVYVRTLKCASEFFYRNFTEVQHWQPTKFSDIDWNRDKVFSYIMNPIIRRHKGIGEFLIMTNTVDLLFNDQGFAELIATAPYLDSHSASLHNIYGNYVNKINWLLIDDNHAVAVQQTDEFLKTHGISNFVWHYRHTHRTDNYLKNIFDRVKMLWDQRTVPHYVISYFQSDIDLYLKIKNLYYGSIA